jgi:hypothetical protein
MVITPKKTTFSLNTKRTNVFKPTLTKIQSSIAGMARSYRCSFQLGKVCRRGAVEFTLGLGGGIDAEDRLSEIDL